MRRLSSLAANLSASTVWLMASVSPSPLSITAADISPAAISLTRDSSQSVSRHSIMLSLSRYSRNDTSLPVSSCIPPTMPAESVCSSLSWVSTLNVRTESISSSKKSMRYGSSWEKENTSRIDPRREYCPGSQTQSVRTNPSCTSLSTASLMRILPPLRSSSEASSRREGAGTVSASPSGQLTMNLADKDDTAPRASVRNICCGGSGWPYLMSRLYPDGSMETLSWPSIWQRSW